MRPRQIRSEKGTVLLVVLCFAMVLAISLTSYLAMSRSAMELSNRSLQTDLSKQLAETGLETALSAFNTNDWSGWSVSGTTATRTVTFAEGSAKYGRIGVTGSIKLRVDNYDAYNKASDWSAGANYRPGDFIGYGGTWYTCVRAHSNQAPPNRIYWIEQGVPWKWSSTTTYRVEDVVNNNGYWYRCISAHTNQQPPSASSNSYWTYIPYLSADSNLYYTNESVLNYYGTWYRYNSGWDSSPAILWRWRYTKTYSVGDVVCYSNVWYQCIAAHTNSSSSTYLPSNTSAGYWTRIDSFWPWSSSANYNTGDVVYVSGTWYRCIRPNLNSSPPNTAYWSNAPRLPRIWSSTCQYSQYDTVLHNGVWYLSLQNTNLGQNPATATSWWVGTTNSSYQWNSTTSYSVNTYRHYGGVWYKCLSAGSGKYPNNSSYWTNSWSQGAGVTTGAPVIYSEGVATPPSGPALRTQLRATVGPAPLFNNAISATSAITLSSGVTIDSYDSTQGTYASQTGTSTNDDAVLAAGATSGTAIAMSSANIKGYVAAPGSNSAAVTYATSARLTSASGAVASPSSSASNVDLARISASPYLPSLNSQPGPISTNQNRTLSSAFSANDFPYGTNITSLFPATTITLGTPGATTPIRYYYNNPSSSTLNIGSSYTGSTCRYINIVGPVILYVNGNFRIRSGGSVYIRTSGSLELHADGGIKVDSASDGIQNDAQDPKKVILISDITGSTTQYYDDTSYEFYGIVYVPNSSTGLGFDIGPSVRFYGAVSASEVTVGNNTAFHFDTSLRYIPLSGTDSPYILREWRELPLSERASL